MKLWVTHSQFIVEHINAMTTLAREHTMLTRILPSAISNPVRLRCSAASSGWTAMVPAAQGMPILWSRRKARRRSVR